MCNVGKLVVTGERSLTRRLLLRRCRRARSHQSLAQDMNMSKRKKISAMRPSQAANPTKTLPANPDSLLDICARHVAANIPFQRIEERFNRIPEPVQERICFWSFPRKEFEICMYSSMSQVPVRPDDLRNTTFGQGTKLVDQGCVKNALQVGFHLSGEVGPPPPPSPLPAGYTSLVDGEKTCKVSLSFDRCKITEVTCSCDQKDIFWCAHVVALSLYRIRHAEKVQLRIPISETLLQMDRQQLQKLVQYLISQHHTEVLPTAQRLADEIMQRKSSINQIDGAPDPTAGADANSDNSWHLDEAQVRDQVKSYLSQGTYYNANKQLTSMFSKVREMLRVRDSNGSKMLMLITEQFLADPRLILWKSQGQSMHEKCRLLWDQLGSLWVSVVLNPKCDIEDRQKWTSALETWARLDLCPLEDPDYRHHHQSTSRTTNSNEESESEQEQDEKPEAATAEVILGPPVENHESSRAKKKARKKRPRTIFHMALDALMIDWSNPQLLQILSTNPGASLQKMLWQEHVPTACARIDALKTHGYDEEAVRLAVAVARTVKYNQNVAHQHWLENQDNYSTLNWSSCGVARKPAFACPRGWIGHALNPIGCLFNTLVEPCILPDDRNRLGCHLDLGNSDSESSASTASSSGHLKYFHQPLSADDSYMFLAIESALIALGQQRLMPGGLYAQEKAVKQEQRLLSKLQEFDLDPILLKVHARQANILLEMGPTSGLGFGIHPESIPMQTYAKYLFHTLLPHDFELAFKIGLRAMRMPILDEMEKEELPALMAAVANQEQLRAAEEQPNNAAAAAAAAASSFVMNRLPRWFTIGHIESQQCALASRMLNAAKGDFSKLSAVLEAAQRHIHSSSHLFKVAQDAFRYAMQANANDSTPHLTALTNPVKYPDLLKVAFQLGLQVMRMTLTSLNWRRREMVRWLVTCATEVGLEALIRLMQSWKHLFTPTEASTHVATSIMSHSTVVKLNLDFSQQEQMAACARALALQCAQEDPASCALSALTLCENEPLSFETAYQIVIDAAAHIMTSSQLFAIARYMEHRGYPQRAHKLAILAMASVQLAYNQDTHPAINDIHWAATISHDQGKEELSEFIPLLVKNVQCATVLADILRRCVMTPPGMNGLKRSKDLSSLQHHHHHRRLPIDRSPLRQLLEATISAFVTTTHSRLSSISPRHYNEFIDFLTKARETFLLAADGSAQFAQLVENMKLAYKGKKKLICLIKERFG